MATQTTKTVRTIKLSKRLIRTHKPRRIGNSIRMLREEIARHTKTGVDNVKIGSELNRYLLKGAMGSFAGIKIAIEKTGEAVKADLFEKRKKPTPQQHAASSGKPASNEKVATEKAAAAKEGVSKPHAQHPAGSKPAAESRKPPENSKNTGQDGSGVKV